MKPTKLTFLGLVSFLCICLCCASPARAFHSSPEDFSKFLEKFTTSAEFQYSRIKFPLKTPITLLSEDGNSEKTFPFTREKWALLDDSLLKVGNIVQEGGGIYSAKFTTDGATHKVFEAGSEDSELDLRIDFELIDNKWYVTDCYSGWYAYDLPVGELKNTILQIQEDNKAFKELHP